MKNSRKLTRVAVILLLIALGPKAYSQKPELLFQYGKGIIGAKYSPGAPVIAFTTANYTGLYLWQTETRDIKEVSNEAAAGFGFSWSRSGAYILYKPALFLQNRRYDSLVRYDVKSGDKNYILSDRSRLPGKPHWINENYVLLQGFGNDPIAVDEHDAQLSAPYFQVAGTRIEKVNPVKGEKTIIMERSNPILSLAASLDGTIIAFEEYGGHLFILDTETLEPIDIGSGNEPVWSPDGARLAFMKTTDDGHRITSSDILIVRADGTDIRNLTSDFGDLAMRPSWSPDGRYILFDNDANNLYRIEVR